MCINLGPEYEDDLHQSDDVRTMQEWKENFLKLYWGTNGVYIPCNPGNDPYILRITPAMLEKAVVTFHPVEDEL